MGGFVVYAAEISRYILDMFIQLIVNDHIRRCGLVVHVADFVGDLVAYIDRTKLAGAFVRRDLLLVRLFGNGVLDDLKLNLVVVADLHPGAAAAVHDLAGTTLGLLRTLQHLDLEGDGAFGIGGHILQRPDDLMVGFVIHAAVGRAVCHILDVLIQSVLDGDIRGFGLIVVVADLIGDLVAHVDRAELAGALVGIGLLLVRLFGHGVLGPEPSPSGRRSRPCLRRRWTASRPPAP